jgi:molybdate transport system substrate-binding protein
MPIRLTHTLSAFALTILACSAHADRLIVAAASDLKFALTDIRDAWVKTHPGDSIDLVFGSSGNLTAQVKNGAPYDALFSADIAFPRQLEAEGFAASKVVPYAVGRIVVWLARPGKAPTLAALASPVFRRVAIANPNHAPYGMRAVEALKSTRVWDKVKPKLALGENIAQTAQFVESGAADAGIVALSLVTSPELAGKGAYILIDDALHAPLQQAFVITRHGSDSALAHAFTEFSLSPDAIAILKRYGFKMPAR